MKIGENFIDTLNFLLSETNFDEEFFIIYDKETDKLLPYIPSNIDKKESLLFLAASINLEDKNKYYVIHSTEFPKELFDKVKFVYHIVDEVTEQSIEEDNESSEPVLNLEQFFTLLKDEFNLNENQLKMLSDEAGYYTDGDTNILKYYEYLEAIDYDTEEDDYEFSVFQECIVNILLRSSEYNDQINLAMIKHIKENSEFIEDIINKRLKKLKKLLSTNKTN